ncbi:uncharacterized protein LOC114349091 isoform X2 [Diabrotica virgifera virgifera]|uniref:Uncharacterized protein n=1 Tax=Diabrotica virgifera virgifera TaxID=50390 RepID=A0ABM5JWU3_DIAVI|nr:uncharacterized protein LOC114349091 isoform X2 [Diabrotica virgifera virgifera]
MKLFIATLIICFGISLVLSTSENQNDKQQHIKEKSHVHHEKGKNHHLHEKHHHLRHHNHHLHEKTHHKSFNSRGHSSEHHHHQTAARSHYHHGHSLSHAYRSQPNNQCSWVCNGTQNPTDTGLEVTLKSSKSLFALLSKTTKYALILDFKASTATLLSGSQGTSYVSDLQAGSFYQLQHSDLNWNSSSSFQDYLEKFSAADTLKAATTNGQTLDINNLSGVASTDLQSILKSFGVSSPPQQFLNVLLTFSKNVSGVLAPLFRQDVSFTLPNNFEWFLTVTQSLAHFRNFGLDITPLNSDCRSIFSRSSGIEVLINLLSRLGRNNDLGAFINNITSSRETALGVLRNISAGSNEGLDGLLTVLVHVVELIHGQGSVDTVVSSVLKLNTTSINEITVGEVVHKAIEAAEAQERNYPHNEGIKRLLTFLRELDQGTLAIKNIRILDLIKLFLSPNPLDKIRSIVHIFSNFSPSQGIPAFFKFVTEALGSQNGTFLSHLIPGFNISQFTNGANLQNILQGRNWTELFSNSSNFQSALSHIPIFGQIAKQISSAFGGDSNLSRFFNASSFQNIFSNGFGDVIKNFGNPQGGGNPISGIVENIQKSVGNIIPGNSLNQSTSTEAGSTEPSTTEKSSANTETTEHDGSSPAIETTEHDGSSPAIETTEASKQSPSTEAAKSTPPPILADPFAGGVPNLFGLRGNLDFNIGLDGRNARHQNRLKRNVQGTA